MATASTAKGIKRPLAPVYGIAVLAGILLLCKVAFAIVVGVLVALSAIFFLYCCIHLARHKPDKSHWIK